MYLRHITRVNRHLVADDDAVAASGALAVQVILRLAGAFRAIGVTASGTSTVELDARAGASDAVALACAAGGSAGDRAWGGAVAAAGAERWNVGFDIAVVLAAVVLGVLLDLLGGKLGGELFESWVGELLMADLEGLLWLLGLWADNLGLVERATLGDATVG